jgi:uncharacterized delta-60 repeat protein
VLTDFHSNTFEYVSAVVSDSSFRPVAVGYILSTTTGTNRIAIARYNTNGTLDTSFSGDGRLLIDIPGMTNDAATSVRTDSSNRIITAGAASNPNGQGHVFALTRVTASGSLDSGFGSGGITLTDFPDSNNEFANALVSTSSGRWVAVGWGLASGVLAGMAAARYSSNGILDTTYAGDGTALMLFPGHHTYASGAVISSDKVTLVGYSD